MYHWEYCYLLCVAYAGYRDPQTTKRKSGIRDWHLALFVLVLLMLSGFVLFIHITLEGTVGKFEVRVVPSKEKSSVEEGVSHI